MDEITLRKTLSGIPLGGVQYFEQTGSTNDEALDWAGSGAADLSLVVAEEQTAGRGRGKRRWFTPKGAGLAFSLVLRPQPGEEQALSRFSALGGLAVCEALETQGLQAEIKWPNDVLLRRRKVCGVLTESVWVGDKAESIVLGIGINIKAEAVPPAEELLFPATCLEAELLPSQGHNPPLARAELLEQILRAVIHWRGMVREDTFLQAWESRLAFRGEQVEIRAEGLPVASGELIGLGQDGSLRLLTGKGQVVMVPFGEMHLRLVS